jgi:predicted amidophosphoribosyltransferase
MAKRKILLVDDVFTDGTTTETIRRDVRAQIA